MPQPPKYQRTKDFTVDYGDQTDHAALNSELDSAASSINSIRTNLALIQRDDGGLKQGVVTADSVDPSFIDEISSGVVSQVEGAVAEAEAAAVSATNAALTATAASTDANASKISAANSATAATLASQSASTSANAAQVSQTAAAASQTAAAASQAAAATSAGDAATSATAAAASATAAANSATTATTQAGVATTKATEASTSAASASASLADFKSRYYGPLASDPSTDPNGNAIDVGDLYANTTTGELRRYSGSAWVTAFGGIPNDGTVTYPKLSSDLSLKLSGFKNRIINGNFRENQRAVSGTVTLSANQYGHDRWKAGAGGCTYTFAASGNDVVITITAGSLAQVIEDRNIEGGVYALSHEGTAQARIAINGASTTGAYAAATKSAPLVTAAANANQQITVEFSTGTVSKVLLEQGSAASAFERRGPYELRLCRRYFLSVPSNWTLAGNAPFVGWSLWSPHTFPEPMRTTPTVTPAWGGSPSGVASQVVTSITAETFSTQISSNTTGNFYTSLVSYTANAEL